MEQGKMIVIGAGAGRAAIIQAAANAQLHGLTLVVMADLKDKPDDKTIDQWQQQIMESQTIPIINTMHHNVEVKTIDLSDKHPFQKFIDKKDRRKK